MKIREKWYQKTISLIYGYQKAVENTEYFEGGIEEFYDTEDESGVPPHLNGLHMDPQQEDSKIKHHQHVSGMSSNEMKDVFQSITKQHVVHSSIDNQKTTEVMENTGVQPFIPMRNDISSMMEESANKYQSLLMELYLLLLV